MIVLQPEETKQTPISFDILHKSCIIELTPWIIYQPLSNRTTVTI